MSLDEMPTRQNDRHQNDRHTDGVFFFYFHYYDRIFSISQMFFFFLSLDPVES